jgi:hypothetical protein
MTMALYDTSSWLDNLAFVALRLERLVERLLPAGFRLENVVVLPLELARRLFLREHFLNKGLLSVLLVDAAIVELGRALDDGPDMAEGGYVRLGVRLFVMPLRVEHVAHLKQLEITPQLGRDLGLWQVEPFRASGGLLFLVDGQLGAPKHGAADGWMESASV